MMPTFTGTAFFTEKEKFDKLDFSDVDKKPFSKITNDGWIGIIQRYFRSFLDFTWRLKPRVLSKKIADNMYSVGVITQLPEILDGQTVPLHLLCLLAHKPRMRLMKQPRE